MRGSEVLRRAGREFGARLELVTAGDWDRPTPCDAWTVRDLVNHVVGGNLRYAMVLRKEQVDLVNATYELDALGTDPRAAFTSGLEAIIAAFDAPDALTETVFHPKSGPMTGAHLRILRVNELAVHAWDLARAIGADDRLDSDLVGWLYERLHPIAEAIKRSGMYKHGDSLLSDNADPQDRLLYLLGRQP